MKMARRSNIGILAAIVVAALMHSSAAQTSHTVGGSTGWTIPTGGSAFYSSWAASQTFSVGDVLVFNFVSGAHDVAQVTMADYNGCTTASPITLQSSSPASITLNATGTYYFICNFSGHCGAGQKLMISVGAAASSPSPSAAAPEPATSVPTPVSAPSPAQVPPTSSPPASAPSPAQVPSTAPSSLPPASAPSPSSTSRSPITYTVGNTTGWTIPTGGAAFYQNWTADKTFLVGDILVFNYANGAHDVTQVTSAAYVACNATSPISQSSTPPTRITLNTPGPQFFICGIPGHCSAGQKLAINVTGTSSTPSPSPSSTATPPSPSTASSPSSPTAPSSPSPTGSTTAPPPGNSATSLAVTGLSATFLSILVALLF